MILPAAVVFSFIVYFGVAAMFYIDYWFELMSNCVKRNCVYVISVFHFNFFNQRVFLSVFDLFNVADPLEYKLNKQFLKEILFSKSFFNGPSQFSVPSKIGKWMAHNQTPFLMQVSNHGPGALVGWNLFSFSVLLSDLSKSFFVSFGRMWEP